MAKRAKSIKGSGIVLDQNAALPLYRQLYERLRAKILAGQLEAGARLPSTRTLASQLGVSRNTTALAYEQLLLEGYIESRVGDGTRVALLQAEKLFSPGEEAKAKNAELAAGEKAMLAQRYQALIGAIDPNEFETTHPGTRTNLFRTGQPDVTNFPYETWARLVAKHARHTLQTFSFYQDIQGYFPLREAIAAHIGITRGVHCSPEQIIMTSGSQGALDLIARVLLNPGDPVWVEDPGYWGARGALLAAEARPIAVPVDNEGIEVKIGQMLCPNAHLAIVTPSHQFPSGVTMSLDRRLTLLKWAREARAWIVEDDYDSEFRFSGRPLEALQGLDSAGRVLYIGTFSKVLFPALRLGYLVAPPELLKGFLAARYFIDVHLPLLEQMALADFMIEGHFVRYLRKMRQQYLERRDALVEALVRGMGASVDITIPEAGMHLVVWLPQDVSAQAVMHKAKARRIYIVPVSQFSTRALPRDGLLLGFASSSPLELRSGVQTLVELIRED
ncbi:PLP-dependent aminotransferase family protein [Ktedonosporobacter rubrisoli]|uniref:PLP-dependent aminotransferase family protein n=1 Tax=Ktedonosporobacter rubrisoli TaxID=2509675 RepID=A0A4P6K6F2_KTERU|nr:PLP-dependent aminotransferase family protein [Ktedonosporobacter rubrisoli]QBD83176.1 PLP-dependent aminotransferase family protein [Ktedonosporobacter rubrisoli]